MTLVYTTRPLSDRSWLRSAGRKYTPFDSTWSKTLTLLAREISMLGGRGVVIEVDVPESAIRLDGGIRATAKAETPGVVVAFESKHGPLLYRCDRFTSRYSGQGPDWQQNVRAIALSLESLRAVDRYGATDTGQQYSGWKQLEAPAPPPEFPWAVLEGLAGVSLEEHGHERVISLARRKAHPDQGGTSETWARFTAAYQAVRP